jgi:hypothetical protein
VTRGATHIDEPGQSHQARTERAAKVPTGGSTRRCRATNALGSGRLASKRRCITSDETLINDLSSRTMPQSCCKIGSKTRWQDRPERVFTKRRRGSLRESNSGGDSRTARLALGKTGPLPSADRLLAEPARTVRAAEALVARLGRSLASPAIPSPDRRRHGA